MRVPRSACIDEHLLMLLSTRPHLMLQSRQALSRYSSVRYRHTTFPSFESHCCSLHRLRWNTSDRLYEGFSSLSAAFGFQGCTTLLHAVDALIRKRCS